MIKEGEGGLVTEDEQIEKAAEKKARKRRSSSRYMAIEAEGQDMFKLIVKDCKSVKDARKKVEAAVAGRTESAEVLIVCIRQESVLNPKQVWVWEGVK